jgi:hypothetical protein
MGSASSTPQQANSISSTTSQSTSNSKPQIESEEKPKRKEIPNNLSGAALVEYKCRKKKKAWTNCIKSFYESRFLPGEQLEQEGECDELFERYRSCYMRGMLKVVGEPKPDTLLAEYIQEEGINKNEVSKKNLQ